MNPVFEMIAIGGLILTIMGGTFKMSAVISKLESKVDELIKSGRHLRKTSKKLTKRVAKLEMKVNQ